MKTLTLFLILSSIVLLGCTKQSPAAHVEKAVVSSKDFIVGQEYNGYPTDYYLYVQTPVVTYTFRVSAEDYEKVKVNDTITAIITK